MKREAQGAPYKNILPIIQSSGTDKSRLAHELAKIIVTLPLNIRDNQDRTAYPPPDSPARNFLIDGGLGLDDPRIRYLAFFIASFSVAAETISALAAGKRFTDELELAQHWKD